MPRIRTGAEVLLEEARRRLGGRGVGLLCNQVSVDPDLVHVADRLHASPHCDLVRLFAPEHGVRGGAQDMIPVDERSDPRTGLPVCSLYGKDQASLRPDPGSLMDLDVLICDLQDVGSRYYTYVWTVILCIEVAVEAGVEVLICDRPNPLGGLSVEGGTIELGFESFVGLHPVPNRHGLTLAELARLVCSERGLDAPLKVVPMLGWRRDMIYDECGIPWVMPSPNMPTLDTAFVYPGMCLVEATEVSEGRGTTRPFELVGAPYVDPQELASSLEELGLPGVRFRPTWFLPQFQKHAGSECGGVQLHVTDRAGFRPYRSGVALLATLRRLYPEDYRWRERPYEFVADIPAVDLLTGSPAVREALEAGAELADLEPGWERQERAFLERRAPFLLY